MSAMRDGFRKRMSRSGVALAVAALAVGAPAREASAITVPAGFFLDIEIQGGGTWTGDETSLASELVLSTSGDETTLELAAPKTVLGGDATIQDWDSTWDADPFVTNNFVVANNSGVTQTYTVSVTSPVASFNASQIVQSNIILSINDDDGTGGASVSSVTGTDVYEAFVNATEELSFLDDPFSNSCTSPVDCALNGTSVGAVASQAFGPVVATSMGITITFDLSAGDSAAVQSRFEIIPEPATATLVLLALAVGFGGLRRTH